MATESLREQLEELAKGVATGQLTLEHRLIRMDEQVSNDP